MGKQFKIILCGDGRVGKTTLRRQFLGHNLDKDYQMTLGADFAVKRLDLNGEAVTLQIWDLAGQPQFSIIRDRYYAGADGILLVFDLTNRSSYDNLASWLEEYMKNTDNKLQPLLLIGNKSDLVSDEGAKVSDEEVRKYLDSLLDWGRHYNPVFTVDYIKTSALHGQNVNQAFENMSRTMIAAIL